MPIDSSIALQTTVPQQQNQLAQAAQAFTLKSAMLQSQQAEQSMQAQQLLSSVISNPDAYTDDPQIPGVKLLKPEAKQELSRNPLALKMAQEGEQKMVAGAIQRQELQAKQADLHDKFIKQVGPVAATLAAEAEAVKGDDAAKWAAIQPKVDAANQQFAQLAQQYGVKDFKPAQSLADVQSEASHFDKYAQNKLRAAQPSTPHELAMEGKPQSAEGKVKADVASGKLTPEEGKKALEKKDRININMSGGGLLDEDTKAYMAQQYLSGDKSVLVGLARNGPAMAAMRTEIVKQAREMGMKPADVSAKIAEFTGMVAGERTLGTRTANIEMAGTEAAKLADLALEASKKVDRTNVKSLNTALQAVQKGTASPDLRAFVASNTSLINAYARAINPQGVGTVADKEHAREMLDTAFSKGDYEATVKQLLKEIDAARQSPGSVKGEMRNQFTGSGGSSGEPANRPPISSFGGG